MKEREIESKRKTTFKSKLEVEKRGREKRIEELL